MAGIYIHIPFCASFCRYCSFYSERCRDTRLMARYVDALSEEIRAVRLQVHDLDPQAQNRPETRLQVQPLDPWAHPTLYIGGGTPSLLPPEQLARIVTAVRQYLLPAATQNGHNTTSLCAGNDVFGEFSLEANPDDITPESLAAWKRLGVNRLSIGVQSFDDGLLRWMGRRHTAAQAENAVRIAREAGFDNISLDLIFGYTGLSDELWLETLDRALALNPEHLSCYQMSVEEGSALGEEAAAGAYAPPAQETCARQYALLRQRVAAAGFHHYEISNFARPGYESHHNSAYWHREPYQGFGPGAHSYDGERLRRWNNPDLDAYLAAFTPAATDADRRAVMGSETLSDKDLWNERVMLALRTAAGLDLTTLAPEHRAAIAPAVERLLAEGLLERLPQRTLVRIPAERFFISDSIISDLFL